MIAPTLQLQRNTVLHPSTCYQLQDKDENHPQVAMQKQPPSPFSTSYHLSLQNSGNCEIPYRQLDPQGSTNGIPEPRSSPFPLQAAGTHPSWLLGGRWGKSGRPKRKAPLPSASNILGMSRYFSATSKAVFKFVSGSS